MAAKSLCLENLGDLAGGEAGHIIDREIAGAIADLDDRGDDEQTRKVVITLTLKKMDNASIAANVSCKTLAPARRTNTTIGEIRQSGKGAGITFNSLAPKDPRQVTMDDLDAGKGE